MKITGIQKILWALAGAAVIALILQLSWPGYRTDLARSSEEPAFFGFANCPDVCPTTLAEVAAVIDELGEEAERVQPIFITIDPERDTPMALAEFVPRFDAGIIALTGTPAQIAKTAETFPIYFERVEEASTPDGYTMGHTSHLFLFDPLGGFAESWPYGTPAEEIVAALKKRI